MGVLLALAALAVRAEMLSTWGLPVIDPLANDPRNVALGISELELEGFTEDTRSEYRARSVRRTGQQARLTAVAPRAGRFHPGFILYDAAGAEHVALYVDGSLRGEALADRDDNRQRLFFTADPVDLRGGEKIELRAMNAEGGYRIEKILLLANRPEPGRFAYEFRDVRPFAGTLTWVTNWPARCTVEWEGGTVREPAAMNNHRVILEGVQPGRPYRYRISAATREGGTASTGWKTFTAEPRREAAGGVRIERVPLAVDGVGHPVTAGAPFPKGALGSEEHILLRDPAGGEEALQTRTLARWDDGSVKWALLDFYGRSPSYTLEYGTEVQRRAKPGVLRVSEDAGAVTVSTGPLVFRISKLRFGFLEALRLNGAQVTRPGQPGAFYLTGADGQVYDTLAKPDEVVIEERGPVRACIRVSGRHRGSGGKTLFAYTLRFHAWAGRPYLRVLHTFGNDGAAEFASVRSLVLRLPLVGSQEGRRSVEARNDRQRERGVVRWNAVTLSVRDFWQNYPKALSAGGDGIEFGICPALRPSEYAWARGTVDEHRLFYYLQDGLYRFRQGMTKTHEFWIAPDAVRPMPLMAAAPPEWYGRTEAAGRLSPARAKGLIADYDAAFSRAFGQYLDNRERNREYGMMNWGDWWGERGINWGNSEYDAQHSFFLQFLRTGDWRYFRTAEEAEWHNRDVDAVHYSSDPVRLGGVWLHAVAHTGDYFAESPVKGQGIARGGMSVDHTVIEGHLDNYFLTGDRRSLETARLIADRYCGWFTRNYDFNNCRQAGWHLILAVSMYEATGDPYYLHAAQIVVERVLERQTEDGGWRRQLVPGHCYCTPQHSGNAGFMVAVLMTGLKMYYRASGDERAAESIVKASRFVVDDMWMPAQKAFRYTSCPNSAPGGASSYLLFDGLSFAHQRTGDERLARPMRARARVLADGVDNFGKSFTQTTRLAPRFLEYLERVVERR
ncbi:MAG: hypothetical protein ACE15B_21450 [Bryobacteraceae bacterium]